jgi:uncharacterized membrane protein
MRRAEKNARRLPRSPALRIATIAVLTAVTAVFTYLVRIPIAPTRGYLNLGDVAIYFSAFTLGPFTALLAGGLGTGLADLIAGYPQWIPISMLVHGLQGLLAALVAVMPLKPRGRWPFPPAWLAAGGVGTLVMCAGYFIAGAVMFGAGAALVELPGNLLQNVAGLVAGIPLSLAVRKAYPPVAELRW